MQKRILDENKSYNFSDYFYLSSSAEEIVAEFGYEFAIQKLDLPKSFPENISLKRLRDGYYNKVQFVSLNNETARREFYISPLFLELLDYVETKIDIEYRLEFDEKLKGNIDYFLRSPQSFVVVEAKFADMEHGFTQLAVEMIAVDKFYEDAKSKFVFGAITVGDIWRFGILDRTAKKIFRDIEAYTLPTDLDELFAILLGILQNKN